MSYGYAAPTEEYPRHRTKTSGALIIADVIALLGVLAGSVPLFLQGWVSAKVTFPTSGGLGSQILQQVGLDVNQELARIANREIASTLPATLWEQKEHAFQYLFALLVATGLLLIVALVVPRVRIPLHAVALLTSIGAATLLTVVLVRLRDQTSSLPARVAQAALSSQIASRAFALTTGKPQLETAIGWQIYAVIGGVAVVLLGSLLALIFAALQSSRNAATVRQGM